MLQDLPGAVLCAGWNDISLVRRKFGDDVRECVVRLAALQQPDDMFPQRMQVLHTSSFASLAPLGVSACPLPVRSQQPLVRSLVSRLLQKLIPLLGVPNYFATAGNGWQRLFYTLDSPLARSVRSVRRLQADRLYPLF